jgi:hypothetical protein
MLVVDAPAVKWTHGVEYFLCMPPRSGVPWANNAERERTYYAIAGSNNAVVSLPSDVIEFSIEGIYRRSHCWVMAEQWTSSSEIMQQAVAETLNREHNVMPIMPGAISAAEPVPRSRSNSPGHRDSTQRRSVMLSGLEALPMPPSVFANAIGAGVRTPPGSGSPILGPRGSPTIRPASQADSSKTFDAILGSIDTGTNAKKGKKK